MEESDAAEGVAVQLIDGEGEFAAEGAERFMAAAGVAGCGLSYAVVAIMGPQSSGTCFALRLHRLDPFPFPFPSRTPRRRSIRRGGPVGCLVGPSDTPIPSSVAGRGHACVRARWPPVR